MVDFLTRHFPASSFNGRLQVGCRGRGKTTIIPAITCDYSALTDELSDFYFSERADYYLSVNSVTGVTRTVNDLFSLHNFVIDVDCHSEDLTSFDKNNLFEFFLAQLTHSIFNVEIRTPTSVVFTGRGLQFWWSIDGISAKFKAFYDELVDYYISAFTTFINTSVYADFSDLSVDEGASRNAVGYFRMPCTINTKVNQKVTYHILGETYALMDLFEEIPKDKPTLPNNRPVTSYEWIEIAHRRVEAFYRLRDLRGSVIGLEERNNFCFMIYNSLAPCYGHDQAFLQMKAFNQGFQKPMSDRELNTVISSAKEKGGYQYTTQKLCQFLHLTESEAIILGFDDLPYLNKRDRSKAQNSVKKNQRNQAVLDLYDSGATSVEVSKQLEISISTVTRILKENQRNHIKVRTQNMQELLKSGKTVAEVAQICGCSVRTVQRKNLLLQTGDAQEITKE